MELSEGTEFNDPQGKFTFKSLDLNQTYSLTAEVKGYGPDTKESLTPKPEAETEEILFTLKAAEQLRGIIVDAATGAPVSGAQIVYGVKKEQWSHFDWNELDSLNDYGWSAVQNQTSAADGSFSFDEGSEQGFIFIQPAQHARMVVAPADRSKYSDPSRSRLPGGTPILPGREDLLGEALHIPLQAPASIAGRFTKKGQPVVGAELNLYASSSNTSQQLSQQFGRVRTGSDGAFKWDGLSEGTYSLSQMVRSGNMGNNALTRKVELKAGEQKWIDLGADMGPYTLSGRVLEGSAGVEGVFINLMPQFPCDYQSFGGYSQSEGQYKIEGLFPGTYQANLNKWNPQGGRTLFELNETIEIKGDTVHDFGAKPQFKVTATLAFPAGMSEAERKRYSSAGLRWADQTNAQDMIKNPRQLTFYANSELNEGRIEFKGRFDGKYSLYLNYRVEGQNNSTQVQIPGTFQLNNLNGDQDLGQIQVPATGSIRLLMDFDPRPATLPRNLRLALIAGGNSGNGLPVDAEKMEQVLTPVAFGTYKASLFAMAYKVEPSSFDVTVGPGEIPTVGFILSPDGWVMGVAVAQSQQTQQAITPTRITLTGPNGFSQTLVPRPSGRQEDMMTRETIAVGPSFIFKNLAAGTYNLTVEAAGYQTYTATKTVVPGQLNEREATIQLTPAK